MVLMFPAGNGLQVAKTSQKILIFCNILREPCKALLVNASEILLNVNMLDKYRSHISVIAVNLPEF
jgi:hypothetical protein